MLSLLPRQAPAQRSSAFQPLKVFGTGPIRSVSSARAVLDNLHKFVVPAVAGPARLVSLLALATAPDWGLRGYVPFRVPQPPQPAL
jgi:hypothetical protein